MNLLPRLIQPAFDPRIDQLREQWTAEHAAEYDRCLSKPDSGSKHPTARCLAL
jgi:hypothetical protein